MKTLYHEGELAVQTHAGVQTGAARIGKSIRPIIPLAAQIFLRSQQMIVVSTADSRGCVWASLLAGLPGFLSAQDERTVVIAASPLPGDPLTENMHVGAAIGLLAIDLATRRRMRVNGWIKDCGPEALVVHTEQVYSNCMKYIQLRQLTRHDQEKRQAVTVTHVKELTDKQQMWIAGADTFFIASLHSDGGADASHRGGFPGFVHIEHARQLVFPDYSGNTMFQTLGNIAVDPHAGLLFIDFESGDILQLTGRAHILWDEQRVAAFAGAERVVEFAVDEVIEITGASPLRGALVEYSPFLSHEQGVRHFSRGRIKSEEGNL